MNRKETKESFIVAMMTALSSFAASIETDRRWYLSGEDMNVSVSTDNALIAYAELCDTRGLAASTIMWLRDGKVTGTIELPKDLHSGYYVLSVYTRDNANVSRRLVAVVSIRYGIVCSCRQINACCSHCKLWLDSIPCVGVYRVLRESDQRIGIEK